MRGLKKRVEALEDASEGGFKPFLWLVQRLGMTREDAIAAYELENGPIAPDANLIIWRVNANRMPGSHAS